MSGTRETPDEQEPPGTISVLTGPSRTNVIMTGHLDVTMNAEICQAVNAAVKRGLRVDVHTKDVQFIDTAVIGMLAHLRSVLDQPLRFIAPPQVVRSLLDLTGIAEDVEILDQEPTQAPARSNPDPGMTPPVLT